MERLSNGLTIMDVANRAGCSVATASRVLSGSNYPVSAAMRKRILEAASSLGYSHNLKKRMLSTDQNPFLGIIVPSFQNLVYQQFITGVERAASREGYCVFVMNSHRTTEMERNLINSLIKKKVGSLLLMSVDDQADTLNHYLDLGGIACVMESNFPDIPGVFSAKVNRFDAGRLATEHLLSQGHTSIAFLTTPLKNYQHRRLTLDGCRFAIEKHALPFSFENIFMAEQERESATGMYEFEAGYALAEKVLQHPKQFTGLVCLNDMVAYGAMAGLKAAGAHIPSSVSIIGIDNLPLQDFVAPALTTVDTMAGSLAQRAAQLMIHVPEDETAGQIAPLTMKPEIVVRQSVRRLS